MSNLILNAVLRYLKSHPDKVEQLIVSALDSLVVMLLQKLFEHQAANPLPAPAPVATDLRA